MKTYFKFLANAVFRRFTLWIIGVIYMVVIIALMVIIPIISNVFYLIMYTMTFAFVQVIFLYITAIFSALIAVYVFKIFSDDGTELLINSKPISRNKTVIVKFLVFILVSLFFAFFSSLAVFFVFLLPNIVYTTVFHLWLAIIVGNIICMLFFGSISVAFCLWFNKIVVIVINVVLCVLMVIYSTVILSVAPDPASKLSSNQHLTSISCNYVNRNNQVVYTNALMPLSINMDDLNSIKKITYQGQIKTWNQAVKDYPMGALNAFNMAYGLGSSFLVGTIGKIANNNNASTGIGSNPKIAYKIESKTHPLNLRDINKEYSDNQIAWSDLSNLNLPAHYAGYTNVSRKNMADLINLNKTGDFTKLETFISLYLSVYSSFSNYALGTAQSQNEWWGNTYGTISHTNKWAMKNGILVGRFVNGTAIKAHDESFTNYELEPNNAEKDFFNYLIYEIFFDKNADLYKKTFQLNVNDNTPKINNLTWKTDLNYEDNAFKKAHFYRLIYNEFYNKTDINNNKAKDNLNIRSTADYGLELLKFKYFMWNQFNGAYIKNQNDLEHADYTVENYETNDLKTIKVPYHDYYTLVYIPQFHASNLQAKIDSEPTDERFSLLQNILINGLIPTTSDLYNDQTESGLATLTKILATFSEIEVNEALNTNAVISNATPTIADTANEFKAYDLINSNTTGQPDFLGDNIYGYFCPFEVKLQSLINDTFSQQISITYNNDDYTESYNSSLIQSENNLLMYQTTMFNYSFDNVSQPAYIVVYLMLSIVILGIAFKKYGEVDYH